MEDGVPTKPSPSGLTEIERLERALKDAIVQEDYERAAEVRDILAKLKAT
jgi:protein-arginine kinase activator protein McsA